MAIKRKGTKSSGNESDIEYENIEAGEHDARLVYVADLGTHHNEYKGEVKPPVQKLALGLEIVDSSVTIDGEEQPRLLWANPFNVYFSLTEKGKELQMYKIFNPKADAGEEADWDSVLGEPCSVTIANVKGKGANSDKVFDNITDIVAIPKKYQKDVSPARTKDMATSGDEDMNSPAIRSLFGLAKWQFDQRLDGGEGKPTEKGTEEPVESKTPAPAFNPDDDIPF